MADTKTWESIGRATLLPERPLAKTKEDAKNTDAQSSVIEKTIDVLEDAPLRPAKEEESSARKARKEEPPTPPKAAEAEEPPKAAEAEESPKAAAPKAAEGEEPPKAAEGDGKD